MNVLNSIFTVALLATFSACSSQTQNPSSPNVINLTTAEFADIINNGGVLIDVRTPGEYGETHIENAIALDYYSNDFENNAASLPKDKAIYVYCKSGGRSASASKILLEQGHKQVYNLKGGINGWRSAGLPTVQ